MVRFGVEWDVKS